MEQVLLLGHLLFLWAFVAFVHPNHPFHLVPVDLGVQAVLVQHIPIYLFNLDGVMAVLDQTVVVNHLLHHHLHHHHHHHHLFHFPLGEVAYHLHYHHHFHYHLHYQQVVELLLHLPVIEAVFYPFLRVVNQFLHPHHLVVVVGLHHPQ